MAGRGPTIQEEILGLTAHLVRLAGPSDVLGFASPERIAEFDVGGTGTALDARVVRRAFGHHQARDSLDRDALLRATFSCAEAFSPFASIARIAGPDAPESYRDAIHRVSDEVMTAAVGNPEVRGWRAITLACVALADTSSEADAAARRVDERLRRELGSLRDQYLPGERLALRKIDIDLQAAGLWATLLLSPNSVELDREDVSWSEAAADAATRHEDIDEAALAGRMAAGFQAVLLARDRWLEDATPQARRTSFKSPPLPGDPNLDERRLRVVRSTAAAIGGHGPRADELLKFVTPTRIASSAPADRPLTRYRVTDAFPVEKGKNQFARHTVLARLAPWLEGQDPHESGLSEDERNILVGRVKLLLLAAPGAVRIPLGPGAGRMRESQAATMGPASDAVLAAAFTLRWATEAILPRIGRSETLEHVTSWVLGLPSRMVDRAEVPQGSPPVEPSLPAGQSILEIAAEAEKAFGAGQVVHSGETISITLPMSGFPDVVELEIVEVMGVPTLLARCPVPLKGKGVNASDLFALQSGAVVGRFGRIDGRALLAWHLLPSLDVTASILSVDITALIQLAGKAAQLTGNR